MSVNGATPQPISSIVDSGGVEGTLPSTLNVPSGATVTVYAPNDSTPLYSFKNGMDYFPTPTTGLMNTGNLPYQVSPVYIDYGANTLTFYQ